MIVLTALSYNGVPIEGLSARFDELGGSIGRADNNQLVLPDPERSISRQHARVVFRNGSYAIVDNGSNPVVVNGIAVPAGREQALKPGDQLQIGSYLLAVAPAAPAAAGGGSLFDDLFGAAAQGLAAPSSPVSTVPPARPAAPSAPIAAPARAPAAPPAPAGLAALPDDWDFLAPAPAPRPGGMTGNLGPALGGAASAPGLLGGAGALDSLDDLFGLGPAPAGADPLGAAPRRALLLQPNTAGHADPLQSLGLAAPSAPANRASMPDHVSELNTPMPLPYSASAASAAQATAPTPVAPADPTQIRPAAPGAIGLPSGAVFSWDTALQASRVVTLPGQARAEPRSAPPPSPQSPPAPTLPMPAPATAWPMTAAAPSAGADALLAALQQGLGAPGLRIEALSPALLLLVGQLLRESTRGAVELLVARAALKREMRADMTMIVARENNPLKFSPSVEAALQHLLSPPTTGFMDPVPAMRDAFDDLRAHQLGVMAGMKAALDGVLQRFDPQQLEAKLSKRSAINSLIPATYKARLWESFQTLFGQLSSEALDDFDELFGKAFLSAYEAQMDRLHTEPQPTD